MFRKRYFGSVYTTSMEMQSEEGGAPWDKDWGEGDVEFPVFAAKILVGV